MSRREEAIENWKKWARLSLKETDCLITEIEAKDERIAQLKQAVWEALGMAKGLWATVKNHPASHYARDVDYFEKVLKKENDG